MRRAKSPLATGVRRVAQLGLTTVLGALVMLTGAHASDAAYYPFPATWDLTLPNEIAHSIPESAESLPRLVINGDDLADPNGQPTYLWGVGLRVTRKLLGTSTNSKRRLVQQLKNLGFNQIRFLGFDFFDPGIYQDWEKYGDFRTPQTREFCDFVEIAREHSMYFTIDINHISGKYDSSSGPNQEKTRNKKLKIVQLFDETTIKETEKWFNAVLGTHFEGCQYRFAEDPNFFYFNLVNEDSLFAGYHNDFRSLSKRNMKSLEQRFSKYLELKFISRPEHIAAIRRSSGSQGDSVALCSNTDRKKSENERWCSESSIFLQRLESEYFQRLKDRVESTGYNGIVTTTNNWYGYENLITNASVGDVLNTHIYFDPHRNRKIGGKKIFLVANTSFLERPFHYRGWSENHIYRLFTTLTTDTPLFVSEWNHSMWSDYSYEGPLILTAASMLQDVSMMTVHQYLPRWEPFDTSYSTTGYSTVGNPSLFALLPSLSRAFLAPRNFLIDSEPRVFQHIPTDQPMLIGKVGKTPRGASTNEPAAIGFVEPIRSTIGDGKRIAQEHTADNVLDDKHLLSENGLLEWRFDAADASKLVIRTPKFSAVLGSSETPINIVPGLTVLQAQRGAATFTALDEHELENSNNLLITLVADSKNTGEKSIAKSIGKRTFKAVVDPGEAPSLLGRNVVTLDFERPVSIYAIGPDDKHSPVAISRNEANGAYTLGLQNTPWYIAKFH